MSRLRRVAAGVVVHGPPDELLTDQIEGLIATEAVATHEEASR